MKSKVNLLFLLLCLSLTTFAQDGNWKKNSKTADQLFAAGDYTEAANFYLAAYKQKKSHTGFLQKAATCYEKIRLYSRVADMHKELKALQAYPLSGLKYAQALKQNKDYEEAITAFKSFLVNYTGEDKNQYIKLVKSEVEGCEMALSGSSDQAEINVDHLSGNVNTMKDEVAPLAFNDAILYFSSTMEGNAKIFRSQFQKGEWAKFVRPNFPEFQNKHVCHGTFTPDNKRFYFTLCQTDNFDVVESSCDIYVTVIESGAWSPPRKLRDYVKLEGKTATQPFVMHDGEMEILYFASDRKGGFGGMDIWYMTRHVDSPEYDFTLPENAGKQINTFGDEVTPFYDIANGMLHFSSNGHSTIGGFDIFQSMGSMNKFSSVQNMGSPLNSSADDYYFIKNKSGNGGFFSSNRTFDNGKVSTDNDDIFSFSSPEQEMFAQGNVYDKSNNSIITDVQVLLYERIGADQKRLLQSIIANNGTYQFALMPNRQFEIEAIKEGFETASFTFDSFDFDTEKEYGKAIYLDQKSNLYTSTEEPVFKETASTASISDEVISSPEVAIEMETENFDEPEPVSDKAPLEEVNTSYESPVPAIEETTSLTTYVNSNYDGMEVTTSAPKLEGVYYKVQISTAGSFDEYNVMFDDVRNLGTLQSEYISAKNWTRILLSEFYSLSEARKIMEQSRDAGFPQAFVVKYRNGRRLN